MTRLVEFHGTRYWLLGGEAMMPLHLCNSDGHTKLEAVLASEGTFAHVFGQEIVRFGEVLGTVDELVDVDPSASVIEIAQDQRAMPGVNRGYTLQQQIACVRREVGLRKRVYPKWVLSGRMPAEKADHEINCLQAVYDTLAALIIDPYAEPSSQGKRGLETRI